MRRPIGFDCGLSTYAVGAFRKRPILVIYYCTFYAKQVRRLAFGGRLLNAPTFVVYCWRLLTAFCFVDLFIT